MQESQSRFELLVQFALIGQGAGLEPAPRVLFRVPVPAGLRLLL